MLLDEKYSLKDENIFKTQKHPKHSVLEFKIYRLAKSISDG